MIPLTGRPRSNPTRRDRKEEGGCPRPGAGSGGGSVLPIPAFHLDGENVLEWGGVCTCIFCELPRCIQRSLRGNCRNQGGTATPHRTPKLRRSHTRNRGAFCAVFNHTCLHTHSGAMTSQPPKSQLLPQDGGQKAELAGTALRSEGHGRRRSPLCLSRR